MKDFQGNELHVGDKVIVADQYGNTAAFLKTAVIQEIKRHAGNDYAVVSGCDKMMSFYRIYKLPHIEGL